jgi:hypothetical protein
MNMIHKPHVPSAKGRPTKRWTLPPAQALPQLMRVHEAHPKSLSVGCRMHPVEEFSIYRVEQWYYIIAACYEIVHI